MKIPEIQDELREIAVKLQMLADKLSRRKAIRKAAPSSTPMTPELAREIREFAMANWELSYSDIAQHFNVNPGRVSEAVAGKRP
jgi:hypothetical protein